ncbi:sarcosine oxidase subunit gamma [Nitratireductor sp. GCM10026969]|uniref:sarcosine oxidase subunit gamma n=1 Tax=Nitratireductor sp. GCM10026969 TaxID=3252645 RepID=UPI0036086955
MTIAHRDVPLEAAQVPLVEIEELEPVARFSLRAGTSEAAAISTALGLELPARIGDCTQAGGRTAVCLGPDEWVVIVPEEAREDVLTGTARIYPRVPHSLTDISDRERSFKISGPEAITLLSIGCPRDLEKLKPGRAVRTVFDGVQAVLWRDGPDAFRLDVWRSFAPHVHVLLEIGQAEIAAGI